MIANRGAKTDCPEPRGTVPIVDRNQCCGTEACIRVCPYDVFEMARLTASDKAALTPAGRVKGFARNYRQAFAVRADQCHACGLCVAACPEKAISLQTR